jgi:hypothetical protein
MEKKYSKQTSSKYSKKEIDFTKSSLKTSEKSIQFILNYSKSMSVRQSKKIGTLFLNLN